MFGFLIGTACLIGLISTVRRGFHGHHGHFGHYAHHGHRGGCGGGFVYAGGCGEGGFRGERGYEGEGGHEGPFGAYRHAGRGFRGGFRGFGPRAFLSRISERLDLTPGQEKVFFQAFGEVRDTLRKQRGELGETRKDVARAFRADSFDAVLMGDVFGRHDNKLDEVRKAMIGALAKVHEALDERQREKLASLLEEGWW